VRNGERNRYNGEVLNLQEVRQTKEEKKDEQEKYPLPDYIGERGRGKLQSEGGMLDRTTYQLLEPFSGKYREGKEKRGGGLIRKGPLLFILLLLQFACPLQAGNRGRDELGAQALPESPLSKCGRKIA